MFDYLANAAYFGDACDNVGENDVEAKIGLEESVHHEAVAELESVEEPVA